MKIENNLFDKSPNKETTEYLNFFTDDVNNENTESARKTTSANKKKRPKLEEFIKDKDSYSQIDKNDFNLKLEDYNFVWKNKDRLENAGFNEYEIEEAIQENDVLQTTTEYWEEIDNKDISSAYLTEIEKERLQKNEDNEIKEKSYTIDPITKEKTEDKDSVRAESTSSKNKQYTYADVQNEQRKKENAKLTSEKLDNWSKNLDISFSEQEKSKLIKKQESQEETLTTIQSQYKVSGVSSARAAVSGLSKEQGIGAQEDKRMCDKIDDKNKEILDKANKIDDTRKKALQKMQKATQKSQQLTQKANKATAKVGLKSIKGKKLKSKQANSLNNTPQLNDGNATNVTINTQTSTGNISSESIKTEQNTTQTNSIGGTQTTTNTSLVNKSEISNNNSVKQADNAQQTQQNAKTQEAEQKEKVQNQQKKKIQKENAQLVNKQKVQNNEEAKQIGKSIQTQTNQSIKTTEKDFKKVEESCETLNTEKEYFIEQRERFFTERDKDKALVNRGIVETVVGTSFLICGIADMCFPPSFAVGLALAVIGIGIGALGICDIHQGNKGHSETHSAGIEATVKEREVQTKADDTVKIANDDEKQCRLVEKRNIQQEKQIDNILKQSEEQEAEQRKQEEAANAA